MPKNSQPMLRGKKDGRREGIEGGENEKGEEGEGGGKREKKKEKENPQVQFTDLSSPI